MGNYSEIELEYNSELNKRINNIVNVCKNKGYNDQQINNEIGNEIRTILFSMRKKKMEELCAMTNRNLICYVSSWLQSTNRNPDLQINDSDMNGFMNAVAGIKDRSKGLDLILHTPGGSVAATESIVNYLRKLFNNDIRVIVPHMAMSAGTMIACSSKEIIMGKESSLGPIDPQYHNVPAQGVVKEFNKAMKETIRDPNRSLIWREIISQYRPTFVGECKNVINMSNELVNGWLCDCMFQKDKNRKAKAKRVLKELGKHDASKMHDRHYDCIKCQNMGLNVTALENDQNIQDKVLSIYHTYLLSIYRLPEVIKFIENQNGQTFIITGKR